jgi:hypothetical protein
MGFKVVKHSEPSPPFQFLFFILSFSSPPLLFLLARKQWTQKDIFQTQNKVHGLYQRKRSGWAKRGERHGKKEK